MARVASSQESRGPSAHMPRSRWEVWTCHVDKRCKGGKFIQDLSEQKIESFAKIFKIFLDKVQAGRGATTRMPAKKLPTTRNRPWSLTTSALSDASWRWTAIPTATGCPRRLVWTGAEAKGPRAAPLWICTSSRRTSRRRSAKPSLRSRSASSAVTLRKFTLMLALQDGLCARQPREFNTRAASEELLRNATEVIKMSSSLTTRPARPNGQKVQALKAFVRSQKDEAGNTKADIVKSHLSAC